MYEVKWYPEQWMVLDLLKPIKRYKCTPWLIPPNTPMS